METICANTESNWPEMFTELFNNLNGPGYFPLNDGTPCPFCEDKNKIPVVINHSLSTEIKKIPLQIICEEAGLFGSQMREILKSKVQTDYIVEHFYMDVYGKALALKQGYYYQAMPKYLDTLKFAKLVQPSPFLIDSSSVHPNPKVKFPSFVIADPQIAWWAATQDYGNFYGRRINWNGTTGCDWWTIDSYGLSTNSFMPWPEIDKRLYLPDKKINVPPTDEKDEIIVPESNREVENICRIKDPYLVAVNAAIFGKEINNIKEGTEDYYKAAQEYALFGTTQQEIGNPRSTKDENELKVNDCAKECLKQALPLHLSTKNTSGHKPKSSCPSMDQFATSRNVLPPPGFPSNMNQVQQIIVPQKPKVVPTQKYFQKVPTPQQMLLQNAIQKHRQAAGYMAQNFPHSCSQPQQLLYQNNAVSPSCVNACFNETHINTSIIQQQQFNFYGSGPSYDMMIYAQMLQQTQTIISKNRNPVRSVPDFQKTSFLPTLGSSLIPPRINVPNQSQTTPQRILGVSDALLGYKIDDPLEAHFPFDSEPEDLDPTEKDTIRNLF